MGQRQYRTYRASRSYIPKNKSSGPLAAPCLAAALTFRFPGYSKEKVNEADSPEKFVARTEIFISLKFGHIFRYFLVK